MTPIKLIVIGPSGAGKTTAIRVVSETPPVNTDLRDPRSGQSSATTVALDYGEVSLSDGNVVLLYGTPGDPRFDFMSPILSNRAFGGIVLLDHTRPERLHDLAFCLDALHGHIATDKLVVGVGRTGAEGAQSLTDYAHALSERGLDLPVVRVDVRRHDDVMYLIELALSPASPC
jgi:uncharacterized protein